MGIKALLDASWLLPNVWWEDCECFLYLVFCFLILPEWDDFCFCLHSSHPDFWALDRFPCILECLFSFYLLSSVCVCVCGGGCGSVGGGHLKNYHRIRKTKLSEIDKVFGSRKWRYVKPKFSRKQSIFQGRESPGLVVLLGGILKFCVWILPSHPEIQTLIFLIIKTKPKHIKS